MRVKEIEKTANVAWSPAAQHPIYLATGTAAQQLDATFSTSAALEIYALNLAEHSLEMECVGSIPSDFRFHKIVWGSYGMDANTPNGVLVGGADNGSVFIWSAEAIMKKEEPLLHKLDKHSGAVAALDFNPFQDNLLASGASESEIYIWDLNNTSNPMTPGQKSQPPDDVTCIGWNRQVQHIMASTYAGRCVVWDLRKNEPIIKISDSMSRIKCKLLSWHPDVATQLCIASEDDHNPVIQLWDLRFATSPLKVLENHQRGILSMAWCPHDPDLLLSCAKDNRILCWNPNSQAQTGEVVYELPTSNQWSFDVQWCPRNPAVISSCAFDGHISIYSLMGGTPPPAAPSNKIADSFGSDPFAQALPQQSSSEEKTAPVVLKKPPKWLRRPVGASFGFGGKLVTFENVKPVNPQQAVPKSVTISQVVTEVDLVSRSNQLESALVNSQLNEFCALKIANSKTALEENVWNFLGVHFEKDSRSKFLELLGYNKEEVARKIAKETGSDAADVTSAASGEITNQMAGLNTSTTPSEQSLVGDGADAFELIASKSESKSTTDEPLQFAVDNDANGLITQALLTANFAAAVEVCLHTNRLADAVILAMAGGADLVKRTQERVLEKQQDHLSRMISAIVNSKHGELVRTCDINNWREALAIALTYSQPQHFASLCDILGSRLETEGDASLAANACLCYICAGNVEKLVSCWNKHVKNNSSPAALQDLVEKVMILRKAIERSTGREQSVESGVLAQKLSQYAGLLAAQGCTSTAINYLGNSNEISLATLRYRLFHALPNTQGMQQPSQPYNTLNVQPEGVTPAQPAPAPVENRASYNNAHASRQRANSGLQQTHPSHMQSNTNTTSMYGQGMYAGYTQNNAASQGQHQNQQTTGYTPQNNYTPAPVQTQQYPGVAFSGYQPSSGAYEQPQPQPNIYNPAASAGYSQGNATSQPQIFNPMTLSAATHPGPGYSPGAPPYSATATNQGSASSFQEQRSIAPGWNDPPPIKASSKKMEPIAPQSVAPITQPIYGSQQQESAAPGGPTGYQTQLFNPQQYQQQQQQHQQQQQAAAAKRVEEPKPVVKAPLPAEHAIVQVVLEKLANQCLTQSNNPHIKRKLEDVLKKFESLYDKLRNNALSPSVTEGLHHIIRAIQSCDYNTAIAYHAQMVSQGNFSEISSFMPGVKMLMQTAMQMNVFIQQN